MVVKCLFLLAIVIGFAYAQSEAPLLPNGITLSPELEGKIDKEALGNAQNKSIEVFKKKCEENGGPEAFSKAQHAYANVTECLKSLVNTTALQQEIEDAKPNGRVDEVFKKYCQKKPLFKGCIADLEQATKPCFTADEQKNMKTVQNVTEQLIEFVCFKEGDRIALFIAEDGQECVKDKQPELADCSNKTLGEDFSFNMDNFSNGDVPTLSFDEKQCGKVAEMQECMVKVLETCEKPTTANIVESLFKFIRKVTPCKAFMDGGAKGKSSSCEPKNKPSAATHLPVATATLAMGLITALLV